MTLALNQAVPPLSFSSAQGSHSFEDYRGKKLVLYFYPKDSTPGCTLEAIDFTKHFEDFAKANTVILGVSRDSLSSHQKFKASHCMPFELITDDTNAICEAFGVLKDKSMFGKKYQGIERSTFLIDEHGILRQEWRKVNVLGHASKVLKAAQAL